MRVRIWLLAVSCSSFVLAQACGDDTTTPPDGSTDGTTGSDTGTTDSGGNDTSTTTDGGGGDTGTTTDSGSSTLVYTCALDGGTVTSCGQCTGFPVPCVLCSTGDAGLYGRCVAQGTNCASNAPNNYDLCPCGTDAGNCPMGFEVCRNQACRTCGESQNTDGLTCKSGGSCNATDGGCL